MGHAGCRQLPQMPVAAGAFLFEGQVLPTPPRGHALVRCTEVPDMQLIDHCVGAVAESWYRRHRRGVPGRKMAEERSLGICRAGDGVGVRCLHGLHLTCLRMVGLHAVGVVLPGPPPRAGEAPNAVLVGRHLMHSRLLALLGAIVDQRIDRQCSGRPELKIISSICRLTATEGTIVAEAVVEQQGDLDPCVVVDSTVYKN
mmetsp:Transcript_103715/g.246925  ORF Transcript_103715/g.246925 Transcript_103715/m.246925 type:complete len:200 (+) Transcript_103715:1873-2472(+)